MLGTAITYGLGAFVGCAALVRLFRPVAFRAGLVDRPDERKRHAAPTPAVGGFAIFLVVLMISLIIHPWTTRLLGLVCAALLIVIVGMVDDHRRLRWRTRMLAQAAAGLILALVAKLGVTDLGVIFGVPIHLNAPLSVILTMIATVGGANAVNMIDGIDGLAGAASLTTLLMLTGLAAYAGDTALTINFAVTVGAIAGFLVFNIRWPGTARASVFLGNAGAELLGLVLVAACFRLAQEPVHPLEVKVAPFLLAPALIDCLTVIVRRLRRGASPFLAGRDHLHEVLSDAGLSVNGVVAVVCLATLVIGLPAILAARAGGPDFLFSLAFISLWLAYALMTFPGPRGAKAVSALSRDRAIRQDRAAG